MTEQSGLIPIGQAARLLMISEERIRQLVKQGYVPKSEKRGYVQLVGSVQGYLKDLKEDERRSTKSAADSRVRDARALEIELRIAERTRDLIPVEVEGWDRPAYLDPAARQPRRIEARALLAPFDPLIWERDRTERIFGFIYRIEIYTPVARR